MTPAIRNLLSIVFITKSAGIANLKGKGELELFTMLD